MLESLEFRLQKPLWKALCALVLMALLALELGEVWSNATILTRDDGILLKPLREVASLGEYWRHFFAVELFDLQPIRDLSYLLDLQFERWVGKAVFHWTNFAIWTGCAFFFSRILRSLGCSRVTSLVLTALFYLHPAAIGSVAWISARKHLLAALGALIATAVLVRATMRPSRMSWGVVLVIFLSYALACFSQPIVALWPVFFAIFTARRLKEKEFLVLGLTLFAVMVLVLAANYWYYTGPYVLQSGGVRKINFNLDRSFSILAVGRYLAQILVPIQLSPTGYYVGSALNLVGGVLTVLWAFLSFKLLPRRETIPWLVLYFLPLAVVTYRITNIFGTDTYLLISLAAFWVMTSLWMNRFRISEKALVLAAIPLLGFYVFQGAAYAKGFTTEYWFWRTGFETERTPSNTTLFGFVLLNGGEPEAAREMAQIGLAWSEPDKILGYVLGKSVYKSRDLTWEQKVEFLTKNRHIQSELYWYYYAGCYQAAGNSRAGYHLLRPFVHMPQIFTETPFEVVLSDYLAMCVRLPDRDCVGEAEAILKKVAERGVRFDRDKFKGELVAAQVPEKFRVKILERP